MNSKEPTTDELNPLDIASWELCDEHETTFLRDSYCKECRISKLEQDDHAAQHDIEQLVDSNNELLRQMKAENLEHRIYKAGMDGWMEKAERYLAHNETLTRKLEAKNFANKMIVRDREDFIRALGKMEQVTTLRIRRLSECNPEFTKAKWVLASSPSTGDKYETLEALLNRRWIGEMKTETKELKPCPVCEGDFISLDSCREMEVSVVGCDDCGFTIQASIAEDDIEALWNSISESLSTIIPQLWDKKPEHPSNG